VRGAKIDPENGVVHMLRVCELEGSAKSPGFSLPAVKGNATGKALALASKGPLERLEQMVLGFLESLIILALTSWRLLT